MKRLKHFRIVIFFLICPLAMGFSQSGDSNVAELRAKVVAEAKQFVGVPYLWGGTTVAGMDCSGFIYTVAQKSVGVQLPRTAAEMYGFTRLVPITEKEPGDIVFFRTTGAGISHAGIYIGNEQFIHSASDGLNTGVIVSSLNQATWQNTYAGTGQFLPPSNKNEVVQPSKKAVSEDNAKKIYVTDTTGQHNARLSQGGWNGFLENMEFDFSTTLLWNFYTANSFLFNVRGGTLQAHMKYTGWTTQPGFGFEVRFEPWMDIVQIPLLVTISVPYGFRVYAGPVFTIGSPKLIGTDEDISPSIFPGTLGFSWQSPGLKVGVTEISFVQDINWTVFNKVDNSALNFAHSLVAGLVFSTGVRVTIDGANLIN